MVMFYSRATSFKCHIVHIANKVLAHLNLKSYILYMMCGNAMLLMDKETEYFSVTLGDLEMTLNIEGYHEICMPWIIR